MRNFQDTFESRKRSLISVFSICMTVPLIEEDKPSEKIVIVKEKLDGIDIDDMGNLEDLLGIVFIHEECGNLKVFVDGGELTRNINEKKKPDILQAYRCPLFEKYFS